MMHTIASRPRTSARTSGGRPGAVEGRTLPSAVSIGSVPRGCADHGAPIGWPSEMV